MAIRFAKKLTTFLKKLFSIFLIFNLTCVSTAQAAAVFVDSFSITSSVPGTENDPRDVAFNSNGTKMFVLGRAGEKVYEYTLSTGFDVSSSTFVDSFDISNDEEAATSLEFNTQGTKMYIVGQNSNEVDEYTLTTGFDVSTASFVDSLDIASEDDHGNGLAFNNDGTKMFIAGHENDNVYEYTLSTRFDVSTASFVDSFDVSSQDTEPAAVAFNSDGTKMFVVGAAGVDVNEYTLTTGFDVSTATFLDRFGVNSQETKPRGLTFNNDGTKMFVVGWTGDDVNEYTLSCAYKVTSSSTCDDPTTIKDVVGSVEAQTEAAKRFAKYSSDFVLKRLDFLRAHQKDLGYFQLKDGSLRGFIGDSQNIDVNFSNKTLDRLTDLVPKFSAHPFQKILPEDWSLWSEGSVSFGRIGETGLSSAQDISALGITIGADKKIENNKVSRFYSTIYGMALRLGNDEVDIGTYGSKVDTNAISLSIYGTHYLDEGENRFIDGVIGASHLNTDLVRKNSGDTDTNTGERDGKQIYGSIKFGRESEYNEFNVVQSHRINASHTMLDGYTESGTEGLKYDDQEINSLIGSVGVMIDRDYILETSIIKHKANFEYSKDVGSHSKAHSYYASDSSKTYVYKADHDPRDIFKGGVGFDFTNEQGLTLSGEFEKEIISNKGHINTIFFTASFISWKDTEYLFNLKGNEKSPTSSLQIAKTLGPFALGLQLANDLSSQKNSNLNLSLSSQF